MENANIVAHQKRRSEDPLWYFLAEFSLSGFMSRQDRRDDLTAELLFEAVRELDIPPECVEDIEMTLAAFAQEALVPFKQGRMESPERIRIFCQRKWMSDANSAKTSMPHHAQRVMEGASAITYPGTKMNGGWGYFLIERGVDLSGGSSACSWNSIDLYLYKEGA